MQLKIFLQFLFQLFKDKILCYCSWVTHIQKSELHVFAILIYYNGRQTPSSFLISVVKHPAKTKEIETDNQKKENINLAWICLINEVMICVSCNSF